MKYDRHLECSQHLIHSVEPRATISELNVSQDYSGPLRLGEGYSLRVRPRNAKHAVAQALDKTFEIKGDECLIFDDQHVSRDLSSKLTPGFFNELAQRRRVNIEHFGGIVLRKSFEGDQQECLTRLRRDLRQMALDRLT